MRNIVRLWLSYAVPGIILISILVSGFAAQGVAGSPDEVANASAEATDETDVEVAVDRDGDRLTYELVVAPDESVDRLWVVVEDARVVETDGFERAGDERTRLAWTGEGAARVALAVEVGGGDETGESVATDEWAFGPVPFLELQREIDGEIARSWPLRNADVTAEGEFGQRYALAGPTHTVTRNESGRTARVVVPADEQVGESPETVAETLATAAGRLSVGDYDETVVGYGVPSVRAGGESVPARDEFWVNGSEPLDSAESVWLHEYVHTRQSFALAGDMAWFREASAEYYAARLAHEQGLVSERAMRTHIDGPPSDATLTEPGSWDDRRVPYQKGARVLAVLDAKIQSESHGYQSLEDVFRRLNSHDGPVTYDVFVQTVNEVAGTPMDEWLDAHVAGSEPVADEYESGPAVVAAGLVPAQRPTAESFLLATVGLSLVASIPLYELLSRFQRRQQDPARVGATPG
jgi:hypothetical protein